MSNKVFITVLAVIVLGSIGFVLVSKKSEPAVERPGVALPDNGQEHLGAEETLEYGGLEPPASGKHGSPLPWRVYDQEVPDMNAIHNLEHGGIYISYRPDLSQDQIDKLRALFGEPYSREDFAPTKAILAPRAKNDAPIILTSWTRNLKLESYDEGAIVEYYLRNLGKSPEPTAS